MIRKKGVIAVDESYIVARGRVNSAISSRRHARIRLSDYFYAVIRLFAIVEHCRSAIRGPIVNSNYFESLIVLCEN